VRAVKLRLGEARLGSEQSKANPIQRCWGWSLFRACHVLAEKKRTGRPIEHT
jgi:hypothetical protein